MLNFLSFARRKQRADVVDARLVYEKNMEQSRKSAFFGPNMFADSYEGRMEVLCLHLSLILYTLRRFGTNGERLSQAIYDVMIADFDIALREEGLSDTGVARRIKPLATMFFTRAKTYADIFSQDSNLETALAKTLKEFVVLSYGKNTVVDEIANDKMAIYTLEHYKNLQGLDIGIIAKGQFEFPNIT